MSKARFSLEHLPAEEFDRWDAFVDGSAAGTVFHTTRWLRLVGARVVVRVVLDREGEIRGGVATVPTRKMGVRGYHVPPFTPYFGPLVARSSKAARAAARSEEQSVLDTILDDLAQAPHCDFKLPPGDVDLAPYQRSGFTVSVGCTHELDGSVDEYRANIGKSNRNYLNALERALADGRIAADAEADPADVLALWARTAQRKGVADRAAMLRRLFEADGSVPRRAVVVYGDDGRPLAGVLLVEDARRAYNLVNGSVPAAEAGLQANLLCMDTAIRCTLACGKVFDFEGSMIPGVEYFYRQLGGVQRTTFRAQRSTSLFFGGIRAARQVLGEIRGLRT